jgi:DNA-binding transcriptional LysR family regulator
MPRSVTLSLELLQTFVSLIRHDGEAAGVMRELALNQPTLSKRLKYLQHAGPLVDRPWLVRQGKTWTLTDEGRKVWPAVEELVDRYRNLQAFVAEEATAPGLAPVHFACGQQMAVNLVRRALQVFRQKHPDAPLRISTLRGRARIEGVSNGSIDLAIVTHDESSILEIARRPLHIEQLVSHGLALVCAADSAWSQPVRTLPKAGVPAEALARFPLILPEPDAGVRKAIDELLQRHGVLGRLQIAVEIGGWGSILAYVREGFGVGVVSEASVLEPKGLILRPLDPKAFPQIEAKLIGRRLGGSGDEWDLSPTGMAWRAVLRRIAQSTRA